MPRVAQGGSWLVRVDGRIRYLKPVIAISEAPGFWSRPPVPLGYHRPVWTSS